MGRQRSAAVLVAIVAFAAFAYGPEIAMPFVGDDYVFLDATANAPFSALWSFENTAFRWYRPWSRELHFWTIQRLAGLTPAAFRLIGLLLWIGVFALSLQVLRRIVPLRVALVAIVGTASMAMWGTPVLWISGSQDLWMLAFSLLFLLLVANRQPLLASLALALALLSKETAGVLPLLGLAYVLIIDREPWSAAARRMLPSLGVAAVWFVLHPTLRDRIAHPAPSDLELTDRPSQLLIVLKNILATVNLSVVPRPFEVSSSDLVRGLLAAASLGVCGWLALSGNGRREHVSLPHRRAAVGFLVVWCVLGWLPTHLPSIGWHAYYGCLGAFGAWALIATLLPKRRAVVIPALVALALLRAADAKTLTWDWGNEWYMRRAGALLSAIEVKLKMLHPTLPPRTRVYFARLPNNIGLVAGRSAAIRVWYRDSSLTADFYSSYRPRSRPGKDLFLRFDTLAVLTELVAGPEDVRTASARNPEWAEDHVKLAMLFLEAGEPARAADEFEKVSSLENRPQGALYAAVCRRLAGRGDGVDSLLEAFGSRTGLGPDSVRTLAADLESRAPGLMRGPSATR